MPVSQSIEDAINDICEGDPFPQVPGTVAVSLPPDDETQSAIKGIRAGALVVFAGALFLAGMAAANGKHLGAASLIAVGCVAFYAGRREARSLSQQAASEAYEQREADKDAACMVEACESRVANRRAGFVRIFNREGRSNG